MLLSMPLPFFFFPLEEGFGELVAEEDLAEAPLNFEAYL
jgi:hypothetical protein